MENCDAKFAAYAAEEASASSGTSDGITEAATTTTTTPPPPPKKLGIRRTKWMSILSIHILLLHSNHKAALEFAVATIEAELPTHPRAICTIFDVSRYENDMETAQKALELCKKVPRSQHYVWRMEQIMSGNSKEVITPSFLEQRYKDRNNQNYNYQEQEAELDEEEEEEEEENSKIQSNDKSIVK